MELVRYHITIREEDADRVAKVLSDNGIPFVKANYCDSCEHWFECDECGSGFCEEDKDAN